MDDWHIAKMPMTRAQRNGLLDLCFLLHQLQIINAVAYSLIPDNVSVANWNCHLKIKLYGK